jgi:glycosyltransferase A (GT-A) superfamily protein (DUF2064 family)
LNSTANHTAILFFSRSASEECQSKSFSKNDAANSKISQKLIEHTRKEIQNTHLPFFHISSKKQSGKNFGERFSNALSSVFSKGFDNVIAVGNDCPLLNAKDILDTCQLLEKGSNVLGPSNDGGIYLLGIRKTEFEKESFQNLRWQLSSLFSDIQQYFENKEGNVKILASKQDIDEESDLLCLFRKHGQSEIVSTLKRIYYQYISLSRIELTEGNSNNIFFQTLGMRGPPHLKY